VRHTGAVEPTRLHGPTRPEPADERLHAAGARCCAPGAAWCASGPGVPESSPGSAAASGPGVPTVSGPWLPAASSPGPAGASDPGLASDGRLGEPQGWRTGHGMAGHPIVPRRGWRMAGRGLITGGLMLCGWLAASTGHAYAAQITAPPAAAQITAPLAPHGHQADIVTSVATAGEEAAQSALRPVVHLTGGRQRQDSDHPASTLLAAPSFPGAAGVGAGIQNRAAGCRADDPVTALASRVAGVATSVTSGPVRLLGSGLRTGGMTGQVGGVARSATSPVLQLPGRGTAPRVPALPPVTFSGPRSRPVTLSGPVAITPGTSRAVTPSQTSPGRQGSHAARPSPAGSGRLARQFFSAGSPAGSPAVRGLRQGGRHRRVEPSDSRHRRPAPGDRLTPGTANQTDPASSGGGAGAAQAVAQGAPHAGSRNPTGRLVRRSVSRWPAGRLGANDPAVSPD